MAKKKLKVYVGISGGVDSSVAAYLLQKEGYEVHGVFIKTWQPDWVPCTWVDEKRDAMRVCAALNIPFHFLDCEEEYKKGVADYMIEEYRKGKTPNPDVMCNKIIKFGSFLKYALKEGADYIATGHYAQARHVGGAATLHAGKDEAKDQSYFLWTLTQDELRHVLFPIGHLEKKEVRKIAETTGLFTATKKDSQGICFLGEIDMKEFLKHYITPKKGAVLDISGNIIGTHDGAWFYTLGERHGFLLTSQKTGDPHFVISKDIEKNTITVSTKPPEEAVSLLEKKTVLRQINWLIPPEKKKLYQGVVRYHGKLADCTIEDTVVSFKKNPGTISPGQSFVLYHKGVCLGGGVIV